MLKMIKSLFTRRRHNKPRTPVKLHIYVGASGHELAVNKVSPYCPAITGVGGLAQWLDVLSKTHSIDYGPLEILHSLLEEEQLPAAHHKEVWLHSSAHVTEAMIDLSRSFDVTVFVRRWPQLSGRTNQLVKASYEKMVHNLPQVEFFFPLKETDSRDRSKGRHRG